MSRVFLIEDDGEFASELASGLKKLGYTVGLAAGLTKGSLVNEADLCAQAEAFQPDCLIVDLDLGGNTSEWGKRLLPKLKSVRSLGAAFYCVLSVYVSTEGSAGDRAMQTSRDEVIQRGADLVLNKNQVLTNSEPDAKKLVLLWPQSLQVSRPSLPRILVLEDSQTDIEDYKQSLQGKAECMFLSPVKANDELMAAIREFDPALVIVDLMLGGEKNQRQYPGAKIIMAIRKEKDLRHMRIVVCSKFIDFRDPDASLEILAGIPRCEIDKAVPKLYGKGNFPTAEMLLSPLQAKAAGVHDETHDTRETNSREVTPV